MKLCKKYILLILLFIIVLVLFKKRENYSESNRIKVYCINRTNRPDRLQSFWDRFKSYIFFDDLDIEIVPAVDRDNLILDILKPILPMGATGCYYSHIKCFLNLLSTSKDVEYCMIFEDDAVCKDSLKDIIQEFLNKNENYDLLILGDNYRKGSIECVNNDKIKMEICKGFTMIHGSHAYIINKKAVNMLLATALPIEKPYDLFYSDPVFYKDLKVGLTNIAVCTPNDLSDSNTR
jgi:GR25 family glycosyltransferase involved in LPS biosynthesis